MTPKLESRVWILWLEQIKLKLFVSTLIIDDLWSYVVINEFHFSFIAIFLMYVLKRNK